MGLLVARELEKAFGTRQILRGINLVVGESDRVGLVGANGSGKSTLVSLLTGELEPDHGTIERQGSLRALAQEPVLIGETVGDVADAAVSWHAELLATWQEALEDGDLDHAALLQGQLDDAGWEIAHKIDAVLNRVGAPDRSALVAKLSGGERRRVALAVALLGAPDVLVLDEPTNHLDAAAVEWLQGFLIGYRGAVLIVTHDRYLLEAVATRIVEIEGGVAITYEDCSYADYLVARAVRREVAERADSSRMAMIRAEAEWASRSPAARSTKQRARLQRLDELKQIDPLPRDASFSLDLRSGLSLGSTIVELHDVDKSYGDRALLRSFDLSLSPGDRLGILGANGAGKTTLLRLIQGEIQADKGQLLRGSRVVVGVLDQGRTGLSEGDTVFDAVAEGRDYVTLADRRVHVASLLERFLFPRDMFEQKVAGLSGGERARLLLVRLLLHGANVLLLDEPTNDLDLMTLRVLEEALLSFDGCVLVVTHDRAFLDRVCTGVLGFHGDAEVVRYADRTQFQRELQDREDAVRRASERPTAASKVARAPQRERRALERELAELPAVIERLEGELAQLEEDLSNPALWRGDEGLKLSARLGPLQAKIAATYARWEQVEGALG